MGSSTSGIENNLVTSDCTNVVRTNVVRTNAVNMTIVTANVITINQCGQ